MDIYEFGFLEVDKCPYKLPEDQWKDNPTEWPSLQYHYYLIKNPSKCFIHFFHYNKQSTGLTK